MTPSTPVDDLSRALALTGTVIADIRDDQWQAPTPCPGWSVRDLVNHLVVGNRMVAGILDGEPPPTAEDRARRRLVNWLGDDPIDAYRESAAVLLDAFRVPGVLEREIEIPAGRMPGAAVVHVRITETLVHGWDLARATGQDAEFPDDLAGTELAFAQRRAAGIPRTGSPFGPEQPVPDNAPAVDRLAAFLGRSVPWEPGAAESD